MKKKGFTILEMMLVLGVITLIMLITLPNIMQKKKMIDDIGCDALLQTVNGQILAYELSGRKVSSIDDLVKGGYISEEQTTCSNGCRIVIVNGQAVLQ